MIDYSAAVAVVTIACDPSGLTDGVIGEQIAAAAAENGPTMLATRTAILAAAVLLDVETLIGMYLGNVEFLAAATWRASRREPITAAELRLDRASILARFVAAHPPPAT